MPLGGGHVPSRHGPGGRVSPGAARGGQPPRPGPHPRGRMPGTGSPGRGGARRSPPPGQRWELRCEQFGRSGVFPGNDSAAAAHRPTPSSPRGGPDRARDPPPAGRGAASACVRQRRMNGGGGAALGPRLPPEPASPSAESCRRPHWLRRGRDICIRLAHWRSRFPGCASPAPPSCPHLARRPPASRPRLRSAPLRSAHRSAPAAPLCSAPLRPALRPLLRARPPARLGRLGVALPGYAGLIGLSPRSPGSGGRRITIQIALSVCVCARVRVPSSSALQHLLVEKQQNPPGIWDKKKKKSKIYLGSLAFFSSFSLSVVPLSLVRDRDRRQGKVLKDSVILEEPEKCKLQDPPADMCGSPALSWRLGTAAGFLAQ